MLGEPIGPGLGLILAAKGACCVTYLGVGAGLFSATELLEWLSHNDGLLIATAVLLSAAAWAMRRRGGAGRETAPIGPDAD